MISARLVVLSVVTVVSLTSCTKVQDQAAEDTQVRLRLPITTVQRETLTEQLSLPGIVFALPDHSVKVSPGIAGKLVDVKVSPGQQVKRGQVIAILDNRQLMNEVNQAHAKVLVARAGVEQAKTNLLLAQNTEARNARLVEQDVGAEKDLVAAKSQVETARAQVVSAQAQVADAGAAEGALRAQMSYTLVKSPITGLVAQRFLNISDSADTATPIAQIVDLTYVMVEASLPTTEPARLASGQTAAVTTKSLPGHVVAGIVQSVNPVTDNQGTTIGVRILCANPGCALKEGMPVAVTIVTGTHSWAMTVPLGALVADPSSPNRRLVYVFKDGKISRTAVETGLEKGERVEILSGLSPGERVVASGAYGVPDGTEVEAESEALHANSQNTSKSN